LATDSAIATADPPEPDPSCDSTPAGAVVPSLRRSQALAAETGLGVRLSQELITAKVEGQQRVLERVPGGEEAQRTIQELLEGIQAATRWVCRPDHVPVEAAIGGEWSGTNGGVTP